MTRMMLIGGLVVAIATAACGKSEEEKRAEAAAEEIKKGAEQLAKGAEQAAKGAEQAAAAGQASGNQMAQGLQQMAQGFQKMAQGSAKPVEFEQLEALLPEVSGWAKSNAKGEQANMPVAHSRAEATYRKGDSRIEVEIVDSALSQLLLAPMTMFLASGYSERSSDGFKRAAKVSGQPGFEEWNKGSRRGEVTAVVGNRYIVKATGHDVDSIDAVRQVLEGLDLNKLAGLK
jgi:hypothetical protein